MDADISVESIRVSDGVSDASSKTESEICQTIRKLKLKGNARSITPLAQERLTRIGGLKH